MNVQVKAIRLFQWSIHAWLILFLISALPAADVLWSYAVSPPAKGAFSLAPLLGEGPVWWVVLLLVVGISFRNLLRPVRWWSAALIWCGYVTLMDRAWMAGSGGQQLMANILFWNIPLSLLDGGPAHRRILGMAAFWIIRLQLVLVYFVTGVHKLFGTYWPDGTALGILAYDPGLGLSWLAGKPLLAQALTYLVLALQFLIPVAVWSRRTRVPVLVAGSLFHLATALWMGIPEMGLAFIACYAIWLSDQEVDRLTRPITWARPPRW
ncbi:MAG: hypothetical protein KDB84_01640 [Flavobacteriales bacterium]|nr:hypothetical protein [Flavobacteriales bacterium]